MTRVMFLAAIAAFAICAEAASLGNQGSQEELHRAKRQFSWSSNQDITQIGGEESGGEQIVHSHNTFLGNTQKVRQLATADNNKQFVHQGFSLFGPSVQEVEQIATGGGYQHQTISQRGSFFGSTKHKYIQRGGTKQVIIGK
ncbi:uncharacterized protein LOC125045579 [Penaeus chinensis]|uniref:uncharacterized protein LOC125045579 n=1 Tax=Penaeus chinensis TaxID=139456 RepID=UPI001FB7DC0B|nr:uncharacterized protein LOC125045579 [Penaeus chinensis]XP_047498873.1 uncharacterized protein LOC125045579 [Penaeus chinensis]